MTISPSTFVNGTEVDCSNYSHATLPYAALVQTESGYAVRNHMTSEVYFSTPDLSEAVVWVNGHFSVGFVIPTSYVPSAPRIEQFDRITFSSPDVEDGKILTRIVLSVTGCPADPLYRVRGLANRVDCEGYRIFASEVLRFTASPSELH